MPNAISFELVYASGTTPKPRKPKARPAPAKPTTDALSFALRYAECGYRVLPLRGKVPLVEHGAHSASLDPARLREWWERWPNAGIGITLDGLVVVDVDPRNGGNIADLLELPYTCHARTGGGGMHYLYRSPIDAHYLGKLVLGIDLKSGVGSYICVEPTTHASGQCYEWLDNSAPYSMLPAEAPAWLANGR